MFSPLYISIRLLIGQKEGRRSRVREEVMINAEFGVSLVGAMSQGNRRP